jgi:hypothetical protein
MIFADMSFDVDVSDRACRAAPRNPGRIDAVQLREPPRGRRGSVLWVTGAELVFLAPAECWAVPMAGSSMER